MICDIFLRDELWAALNAANFEGEPYFKVVAFPDRREPIDLTRVSDPAAAIAAWKAAWRARAIEIEEQIELLEVSEKFLR